MKYQKKPISSKWFHHVGTFKCVKMKNGTIRLRGPQSPSHACIDDSNVKDVFVWLGRYLALKGKLPKHLNLDEIAIRAGRIKKDIHSHVAKEIYDSNKRRENL